MGAKDLNHLLKGENEMSRFHYHICINLLATLPYYLKQLLPFQAQFSTLVVEVSLSSNV
jgi:hypothetical protein